MNQYENSVAVITGAASGIGLALASRLAEQGCHLALADRDINGLEAAKQHIEALGVRCLIEDLDVADNSAFLAFAANVEKEFTEINYLFNNAGVSLIDSVENQSLDDFHWLMNINFWGVVHGTNAFLPALKRAPKAHIINVSSLFGLLSLPLTSAYNASKFAVRGFSESLKMEMAGTNVSVHCVHPGGIKTNITNNAKVTAKSVTKSEILEGFNKQAITTPEQAADAILAGVEHKNRRILVGKDAKLLDKIVRWFPNSYEKLLGFEKGVLKSRKGNS
ncbi:SDR family NAD(P)-dependent oxidoreductase [Thalassotalea sp. Y01]|uniref:SDR family NAD(P)-dependent oxidoreductase n=1 Tax=Thalassotalea sp. Y01 TaxID=2729613 RepID=UPI00145C3D43|nr:SDR family NAD(P)-dependent oxidoreductase [Thalassotalea sp. Y01]NMP15474.1 SDR family NAD(P)-dependent oxidoreductase [Thalassotalea sp. Y01]